MSRQQQQSRDPSDGTRVTNTAGEGGFQPVSDPARWVASWREASHAAQVLRAELVEAGIDAGRVRVVGDVDDRGDRVIRVSGPDAFLVQRFAAPRARRGETGQGQGQGRSARSWEPRTAPPPPPVTHQRGGPPERAVDGVREERYRIDRAASPDLSARDW